MINKGSVVTIKKQWVWINGEKNEILEKWITKELPYNFVTNYYDANKYIPNANGNTTNGEARIHLERDMERFKEFFGIDEERNFFIFKKDLENFLYDARYLFINPNIEDIQLTNQDKTIEIENLKSNILNDYNESINDLNNLSMDISFFKMYCMDDGSRFYLRNQDSSNEFYKLLRKITVPKKTYASILKLLNSEGDIFYYLKISLYDNKLQPNKLSNHLNNFEIDEDILKQLSASLNAGQNIILNGVPGTGKTHLATKFAEEAMGEDGFILTTATSDWTTFDTIGGLMPNNDGELVFREGKFLQAIKENKWLIIDEINRADIDKAFGQLFTILSGHDVELPYEDDEGNPIKIVMNKNLHINQCIDGTYYIGKDWRIIGTMNSYDKNTLFDLSYAFMRRFMFVEIEVPNSFDFASEFKNENYADDKIDNNYYKKLEKLFEINTSSEIKAKYEINRKLGPAIFLDMFSYIDSRSKLLGNSFNYDSEILADAINAYVVPQFEGLGKKIKNVKKFFESEVFNEESDKEGWILVRNKLEDLEPKRFKS